MNIYSRDDERSIRVQRLVEDWTRSGLLQQDQRERIVPELKVDLRRTNKYLRVTLFLFGFLIVNSLTGFVAVFLDFDNSAFKVLSLVASVVCFAVAQLLVRRYKLYHFGIEEAVAVAAVAFFVVFAGTIVSSNDFSTIVAFAAGALGLLVLFLRFGYMYAIIGATLLAPMIVFDINQSDTLRRLVVFALMLTIFFVARERRLDHDPDHPADIYAAVEAVAWGVMYLVANLQISGWVSSVDALPAFYWATYVAIWLVPAAGLWMAMRDRQRLLLDVNILIAIVTLMSNKQYLGAEQMPWDPILFGVLLVGVALGLRRWLSSGPDGSRQGVVAERLLASERARLAQAGSAAVFAPGAPAHTSHTDSGPAIGGGGRSGGAGAEGSF